MDCPPDTNKRKSIPYVLGLNVYAALCIGAVNYKIFQNKHYCYEQQLKKSGRTIPFVIWSSNCGLLLLVLNKGVTVPDV